MASLTDFKQKLTDRRDIRSGGTVTKAAAGVASVAALAIGIYGFILDHEPATFDVAANTKGLTAEHQTNAVTGSATVATLIKMTDVLLNKRGGYLTNDITPPSIWMDNVPRWEFGVLVQVRDMVRTLRKTLSRSQSQSTEDAALVLAENQFYFDSDAWILPETEGEYKKGTRALVDYLVRLGDTDQNNALFYARTDNLNTWLAEVETRLGSLSQRLSASVGKRQLDISLAGDASATQSTASSETHLKTAWMLLDDVFYEARGSTWALLHLLTAVEVDFRDVLLKKNALVSMRQIIRELEPTQDALFSPVILNGDGLGVLANHSLIMGSHISRANAAIIDLRRLLENG